jgi:hypothetical protein
MYAPNFIKHYCIKRDRGLEVIVVGAFSIQSCSQIDHLDKKKKSSKKLHS